MSARKTLDVFLRGNRIRELKGSGLRLSFQYDRGTLAEFGAESIPAVSVHATEPEQDQRAEDLHLLRRALADPRRQILV